MERSTKRVFKNYRYTQCDEFADYLKEMAGKGWHFREMRMGLVFEKGEPSEETYDVQVFLKNQESDKVPRIETEEYAEYCLAAGWEMADSNRRFVVFRRVSEDAVPIVTPEEKLEAACAAERARVLQGLTGTLIVIAAYIFSLLRIPEETLFDPVRLIAVLAFLAVLARQGTQLLLLAHWRQKKSEEISEGITDFCREMRGDKVAHYVWMAAGAALVALLLWSMRGNAYFWVLFALILAGSAVFEWMRPGKETRGGLAFAYGLIVFLAIFFVVFLNVQKPAEAVTEESRRQMEQMPLKLSDLTGEETELLFGDASAARTVFGEKLVYRVRDQKERELFYYLYRVKSEALLRSVWESLTKESRDRMVKAEDAWGGAEALTFAPGVATYYVLYEDAVLQMGVDHPLSEDEIRLVREKLGY